jgi:hypothetical protein
MSARIIIDGDDVDSVLKQMRKYPGGDRPEPHNPGFQVSHGIPHDPEFDSNDGWVFQLGQPVEVIMTGETGFVCRRSESLTEPDRYCVQFDETVGGTSSGGGTSEQWFFAEALNYATIN